MSEITLEELLHALKLAAEKHSYQRRAGFDALPYINHLIKVTNTLVAVGREKDRNIILAAVLHDIVEDTDVSVKDLELLFGDQVASIVEELTDDMELDGSQRRRLQIERADQLSEAAKKIRITDKASNLEDIFSYPLDWSENRKQEYLNSATKTVDKIRGTSAPLEVFFDQVVESVRQKKGITLEEKVYKSSKVNRLIEVIDQILNSCQQAENNAKDILENIHPNYIDSATNLLHYQVFRQYDLRDVQKRLGYLGLSRLAKAQSHVFASLQTTRSILSAIAKGTPLKLKTPELTFKKGNKLLRANAKKLLGEGTEGRRTRIMVTMPTETADNYPLVDQMLEAGMNCARINCAHDDPYIWHKIIQNLRKAAKAQGKSCKIAMDLAGPKIRTWQIVKGPKVRRYRPSKDVYGRVIRPLEIWIGPEPKTGMPHLPIAQEDVSFFKDKANIHLIDTRGKKRAISILNWKENGMIAHVKRTIFVETGLELFKNKEKQGPGIYVGEIPSLENALILNTGDFLRINKAYVPGELATFNDNNEPAEPAHISCTFPDIFEQVKKGESILFDDGKIEGIIEEVADDHLMVKITYAIEGGAKLREDKGINFPESQLRIKGLTEKDRIDLKFIVENADIVNFSFVNSPEDVRELINALRELNAPDRMGIILKIETQKAFNNLTDILLTAMQVHPIGVMIARGDLAIETGWYNIGLVQEEILSFCQAAHITDIWATQVLEGLAKKGIPSRAEITDAVMAQRADCVMLNKGPYILEVIRLLNTILIDLEPYREKNAPFSPKMGRAQRK